MIVQPVSEEDDRISSLPGGVMDRILEFMPVHDAARTCVLSRKWRYIWANHPTMVFDIKFLLDIMKRRLRKYPADFEDIINTILLHHTGHINMFVLDISLVKPERYCDVDLWLSILSRRGVKVLKLDNFTSTSYLVPSYVLSSSDLTVLSMSKCILKPTKFLPSLNKLGSLNLENMTLSSWVLVTPLLSSLTLKRCSAIHGFNVSAPRLVCLTLSGNDDLNLVPYLTCSNIEYACICWNKNSEHQGGESINLMKLLRCWPKISTFSLDGSCLKYLTIGIVAKEFTPMVSLKRFASLGIDLNQDQIAWILLILKNSPLLSDFDIWFFKDTVRESETVNYLEESNFMMEQLRAVKTKYFTASRAELLFMKILLRSAPLLKRMLVEEDEGRALTERLRMSKELMRLPRASPNAEIIFAPNCYKLGC